MNHSEYQKSLKSKSDAALCFIIADARDAMNAMPDSENAGYYADEINYAVMELNIRRKNATVLVEA